MKYFYTVLLSALWLTNSAALEFKVDSPTGKSRSGGTLIAKGNDKGQTFKVSKTGNMEGVTLICSSLNATGSLSLELYHLEAGLPKGEPLHTETAVLPKNLSPGAELTATFSTVVKCEAGNYALVLKTDDADLRLNLSQGAYSQGALIRRNQSTRNQWKPGNGKTSDLLFRLIGDIEASSFGPTNATTPEPFTLTKHENPSFEPHQLSDIKQQPNIITIMVDDLGWNQIGVAQGTFGTNPKMYQTPNLAKIAAEGLSFTHAYAQPNCAPTRAAMLSGQYPARIHNDVYVVGNLNRHGRGGVSAEQAKYIGPKQTEDVAAEAVTVAEAMRENGYATAHIGKYHVGGHDGNETLPENVGFDINIGGFSQGHQPVCFASESTDGNWQFKKLGRGHLDRFGAPYTKEYLEKHGFPSSLLGTAKHVSDALSDAAEETLATFATDNKPFYLQLHPYAVHGPVRSRPDLLKESDNDHLVGFVKSVDLIIGRVLKSLDDPNHDGDTSDSIAANTLILFTSDNGGTHKNNLPLRGKKGMLTEGGCRVPLIAYWPGMIPANVVTDHLVHSIDYYPTYLELAGKKWLPPETEHPLDGHSFAKTLLNPINQDARTPIFYLFPGYMDTRAEPSVSVISKVENAHFKLLYFWEADEWQLFNIDNDIGEATNLIQEKPEVAKMLSKQINQWLTQEHPTWKPKYPISKSTKKPTGPPPTL